jgi:LacI family transcriptional regulator
MESAITTKVPPTKVVRRGPTIAEVAHLAGVGTATVDRVLNGRGLTSADVHKKVLDALLKLQAAESKKRRIMFLCESGDSFNRALGEAVTAVGWRRQDLDLSIKTYSSSEVQLLTFAQEIEREGVLFDGVVLTARDDAHVTRAAKSLKRRGIPVVCLATDIHPSARHGYVGSDEQAAGAAAAELFGNLFKGGKGDLLFISAGAYHAARDREDGFRKTLAGYPPLHISHRLDVRNDPDVAYAAVREHIESAGVPSGIYSVAGGNSGVGRALVELGLAQATIFVGHELNANSRKLLHSGVMNYLIGRDQEREVMLSLAMLEAVIEGRPHHERDTPQVRIISRFTCG